MTTDPPNLISRTPSRPLRVVHVALQLETGGMERLLVEYARHADRARVSLSFLALGTRGRVADEIEACGWRVTALDVRPGLRPLLVPRLAGLFREGQVDVVHTHNTKPLLYAGPAARVAGVGAVIHTRHGQRHGATRRQNLMFRAAARCADRMVCVSEDSARLCRHEGVEPAKIETILNGIDTRRFAFRGPMSDGPAVFVGRLTLEKDLATLLRATAQVVKRRPMFRLIIAGGGPCATELIRLADELQPDGHVRFLGEVRDVAALLGAASLFVLSSLTEGVPLTVLEAMACGLPVVATRVGGTAEAVEESVTGHLVAAGDAEALADAILKTIGDPETARSMGLAGRARVCGHFDVRTMVRRYEVLYDDVARPAASLRAA